MLLSVTCSGAIPRPIPPGLYKKMRFKSSSLWLNSKKQMFLENHWARFFRVRWRCARGVYRNGWVSMWAHRFLEKIPLTTASYTHLLLISISAMLCYLTNSSSHWRNRSRRCVFRWWPAVQEKHRAMVHESMEAMVSDKVGLLILPKNHLLPLLALTFTLFLHSDGPHLEPG